MSGHFELRRDSFLISTDTQLLDVDAICSFLERAYWAQGRPRRVEGLEELAGLSVCDHPADRAGCVVGLRMAWLCDVFVDEAYRGRGPAGG
jgi:hypothetical protein